VIDSARKLLRVGMANLVDLLKGDTSVANANAVSRAMESATAVGRHARSVDRTLRES